MFRGDRGNVGIIRSPVRASILPDLVDLRSRGLSIAPEVAGGDGALGFWKALDETFPTTRH